MEMEMEMEMAKVMARVMVGNKTTLMFDYRKVIISCSQSPKTPDCSCLR